MTASWPSGRRISSSRVLRHLLDVRAALASAERRAPAELIAAIDRMAPMLRFFRHGDGGLALFNGAWEGDRTLIDLVLARSGSSEPAPTMALVSGFQRLAAGTSLVIADAGSPPGRGMDGIAHAGTLVLRDERRARAADRQLRHLSRRAARLAALHALHGGAFDGDGRRHQLDSRSPTTARSNIAPATCWSTAPRTTARNGST